jgi:hypothetical protein
MARTGSSEIWLRFAIVAALSLATGGTLAVAGVAGTGTPDGTPAAAAFRLADGSAACNYAAGGVTCRADGVDAAVALEADGSSHAADASSVAWDHATPVLLPGESWWNGDVACLAGETSVTCTVADGSLRIGAR